MFEWRVSGCVLGRDARICQRICWLTDYLINSWAVYSTRAIRGKVMRESVHHSCMWVLIACGLVAIFAIKHVYWACLLPVNEYHWSCFSTLHRGKITKLTSNELTAWGFSRIKVPFILRFSFYLETVTITRLNRAVILFLVIFPYKVLN